VESPDSDNETLDLDGADCSDLKYLNSEHSKGFANLVGRVIYHKKIKSAADCDTPEQLALYKKNMKPYLYVRGELFSDVDHPEAKSLGAICDFYNGKGEELPIPSDPHKDSLRGVNDFARTPRYCLPARLRT